MSMTTCIPQSAKLAFLNGTFLPGHTYKIALYLGQSYGPTTTSYQTSGEVNGSGYTTGGLALSGYSSGSDGNGAWITWSNPQWSNASFTTDGAIIYDSSVTGNPAVAVISFGSQQTVSNGTFTIQFPSPASGTNAIITGD